MKLMDPLSEGPKVQPCKNREDGKRHLKKLFETEATLTRRPPDRQGKGANSAKQGRCQT